MASLRHYIVRIDSYEGMDTSLTCDPSPMFCVITVASDGRAEIVDNGYRSHAEAKAAWGEDVE